MPSTSLHMARFFSLGAGQLLLPWGSTGSLLGRRLGSGGSSSSSSVRSRASWQGPLCGYPVLLAVAAQPGGLRHLPHSLWHPKTPTCRCPLPA